MARGESLEAFVAVDAMGHPCPQQPLDRLWRIAGAHIRLQQATNGALCAKAAAHMQMIAFDLIAFVVNRHLGADKADVADIMLGAGMVAAGKVDVDWQVNAHPRIHMISNAQGIALGVGGRKFAAGGTRAGYEASAEIRHACGKPRLMNGFACRSVSKMHQAHFKD